MPITLPTSGSLTANRLRDSGSYTSAIQSAPSSSLLLDTGHYETPQNWEVVDGIVPIAPRPYPDYTGGGLPTGSDSVKTVYTHWVTDTTWRVPIGAINGAFPYIYQLNSAPSGMVIEQTYTPDDWNEYGWIKWPQASITAGTHQFSLTIIDQAGHTAIVPMALHVADTNALRIDSAAGASGDGTTWANAYDSLGDVYGQSQSSKLVIMRGSFTLSDDVTGNFILDTGEPNVWVGDPDAARTAWTLNDTSGVINSGASSTNSKMALLHMSWDGSDPSNSNPKQFVGWQFTDYSVVADIHCLNQDLGGATGNDQNNGIIFYGNSGASATRCKYILVKNIYVDNFRSDGPVSSRPSASNNNGGPFKFIDATLCLMEDLTMGTPDTTNGGGIQHFVQYKHVQVKTTLRLCRTSELAECGDVFIWPEEHSPDKVVVEFCKFAHDGNDVKNIMKSGSTSSAVVTNAIMRRCTLWSSGDGKWLTQTFTSGSFTAVVDNCLGANTNSDAIRTGSSGTYTISSTGTLNESYANMSSVLGLDANGDFESTGHANYGKKGWEIA